MSDSFCLELFEQYLTDIKKVSDNTLSSYMRDIRQLSAWLRAHRREGLAEADSKLLHQYAASLKADGKSPATVSRCIASMKCFYGYLCAEGYLNENPALSLTPEKSEHKLPEILTSREVELLLEQPQRVDMKGYRDKAMLEVLYATGIRVSELKFINVEAAKCGEAVVRCKGKTRAVFIVRALRQKLLRYAAEQNIQSGMIFVTRTGKPISRTNIWREMKALCVEANVNPEKVFPHNLRHLFARVFYGIEKDIAKLADILGHSSINTTRIYIISTGTEHRRRMENMRLII